MAPEVEILGVITGEGNSEPYDYNTGSGVNSLSPGPEIANDSPPEAVDCEISFEK